MAILSELHKFVKMHFPKGVEWSANGPPAEEFVHLGGVGPTVTVSPSSVPPPPPPPPLPADLLAGMQSVPPPTSGSSSMGAVFSQINQGEGITNSLKHVDKSQMTHKNPSLREKKAIPSPPAKPASLRRNASGASTASQKRQGKKSLEGLKWVIVVSLAKGGLMSRKTLTGRDILL
jgi:adenylyl cyclase-associated protein